MHTEIACVVLRFMLLSMLGMLIGGCTSSGVRLSPANFDFNYVVSGPGQSAVQRVINDGLNTIVVLKESLSTLQVPVTANGRLQVGQVRDNAVIVEGVPQQLQLKLPAGLVQVQRENAVVAAKQAMPVKDRQDSGEAPDTNLDWDSYAEASTARSKVPQAVYGLPSAQRSGLPSVRPAPLPMFSDTLDDATE